MPYRSSLKRSMCYLTKYWHSLIHQPHPGPFLMPFNQPNIAWRWLSLLCKALVPYWIRTILHPIIGPGWKWLNGWAQSERGIENHQCLSLRRAVWWNGALAPLRGSVAIFTMIHMLGGKDLVSAQSLMCSLLQQMRMHVPMCPSLLCPPLPLHPWVPTQLPLCPPFHCAPLHYHTLLCVHACTVSALVFTCTVILHEINDLEKMT